MRIKPLTSFPTVYRAPSESKKTESSPDQVELTARPEQPVVPAPVTQAVVAAATGPVGPVVADELSKLDCHFFHHKRFHWPWTDAYQPLAPEQAAEALNEGSSRLRVEIDGQKCRLGNLDELAVLEQALTGSTPRPLPSQAAAMVGHALLDPVSGKTTNLYDAFLKLEDNGPIVAFQEGYPLARLEHDKPVKTRDLSAFKVALQASPAEGAALLVEALGADLGDIEPARLYPLSSPHRRVIEAMHDQLSPEQIATRLRLLGDQPKNAALALKQIGLYQPDANLDLLTKARNALKQLDDDPEGFASLTKLGGQSPAALYAAFANDPVAACVQAVPTQPDKVRELFATADLKTAVTSTTQLVELSEYRECLDRGQGSLAERLQALSTASKGFKPELLYDLHMDLVASGNSHAEATRAVAGLNSALDRAKGSYDFENRVALPALTLVKTTLSSPERTPARALYLEQLQGGRPVDVTRLFEPAGSTNLEQRTELMRALRQHPLPDRLYALASGELAQGRSLDQARERTLEYAAAAEKARVYSEDSYHWQYTLEKPYNFYQAELLKPDREPARQLFLEMLSHQQDALTVKHLLPEVNGLDLQRRVTLYRELREGKFATQKFDLIAAEMGAGQSLDQARQRVDELFAAGDKARVYPEDPYHWQYTLEKPYQFYQRELLDAAREPARELFLQLLREKKDATAVGHVLPEVRGLRLSQRVELFRECQQSKFPNPSYELVKAELEAGATLEVAKERAAEFFAAGEGSRVYPEDPYHWQYTLEKPYQLYKDELLADERAPARQLFLQLLREKKDATSVKHVLPEVAGLDLSQRIDLFGEFQKQKFPTQMYDLVLADMKTGHDLEQARQRTAQFATAGEKARVYPEDPYHWEYTLKPVYGLYSELLEPELEPARQFFLELLAAKQSPALVKHVLPDVPGLDLNQRIEVFRELQSGKFAGPMYDLLAADLGQGTTLNVAREHLSQYQQAAEGARVYPEDSYQWEYTLKPSFDLYKNQLLKPDCEAARLYFLELLSQKKDPKAVKVVLNPVANTNLDQRLDLLKELGLFYPAAADLLGDGANLEQARSEVTRLKKALEAHPPYPEASYNWEYHQKPALELYHQAGPFGRQVLVVGLQSGQPVDPLRACLKALKNVLNKAETNNLKLDEFQKMLEALDPKDGRPLEKKVEDIIDTMILKKSMEDESEGNLEVNEEEIWVNDIQVARRE